MSENAASLVLLGCLGVYGLWLHWFLARNALALSRFRAVVLVFLVNLGTVGGRDGAAFAGQRRRMSSVSAVTSGLQAALRLARGRPDGVGAGGGRPRDHCPQLLVDRVVPAVGDLPAADVLGGYGRAGGCAAFGRRGR